MSGGEGNSMLSAGELTPNPKNVEMYGEPELPDHFVEDIQENGISTPITVTEDSHFATEDGATTIISGHRRVAAATATGQQVPIAAYKTFETKADELAAIVRANDYRDKTFSQKMGEADALREIEEMAAEERMEAPLQNYAEGESGLTRDKIAERVAIGSGETYRKASKVWEAAKDDDETAAALVRQLDAGDESIHGAYTTFRDEIDRREAETEGEGEPVLNARNISPPSSREEAQGNLVDIDEALGQEWYLDLDVMVLAMWKGEGDITQYLSDLDVMQLRVDCPPSITSWLLAEKDLLVFGEDCPIPAFDRDPDDVSERQSQWLEHTKVHIDDIRIDLLDYTSDEYDDKLVELHKKRLRETLPLYEETESTAPLPMNVHVAAVGDGTFQLIDFADLNEIRALKELELNAYIDVQVMNVRGYDTGHVLKYAIWRSEWDAQWDRDVPLDRWMSFIDDFVEEHPGREEWGDVMKELVKTTREANNASEEVSDDG